MAIRLVVTRGFGNGTFDGTIAGVVLQGYLGKNLIASGNIVLETVISGLGSKVVKGSGTIVSNQSTLSGLSTTVVNVSGNIVASNSIISNIEEEIDVPKITLDPINGSYGSTEKINSNFDLIAAALNTQIMYRDNPCKDTTDMLTGMDMNLNRIYNLPDAVDAQDPATFGQLKSLLSTAGTVTVGTESQLGSDIAGTTTTLLLVSYEVGTENLSVYVEGRKMALGRDYTESSPITIEWINAPSGTDNLDFYNRNLAV